MRGKAQGEERHWAVRCRPRLAQHAHDSLSEHDLTLSSRKRPSSTAVQQSISGWMFVSNIGRLVSFQLVMVPRRRRHKCRCTERA